MKVLKWITLWIFSFSAFAGAPGSFSAVRKEVEKVSKRDLLEKLNSFVGASLPSRMVGQSGHGKAQTFLLESITSADPKKTGKLTVAEDPAPIAEGKNFYQKDFAAKVEGKIPPTSPEYQKWKRVTNYLEGQLEGLKDQKVKNIVWEKPGINPKKILVVTAHYDTISVDPGTMTITTKGNMPGANYNGTGVAIALSLIEVLAKIDLNYTVRVVFLDWQGIGYLGSYLYAGELAREEKSGKEILGILNLEMLGQDTSYFDRKKKTGNMVLYAREGEGAQAKKFLALGEKMNAKVDFELRANSFDQSDTFRFWERDLPAVTFSQNWEDDFNPKFYQSSQDTAETLNHDTLYGAYKFIGGVVLSTLLDITR